MVSNVSSGKQISCCCYQTPNQGRPIKYHLGAEFEPSTGQDHFRIFSSSDKKLTKYKRYVLANINKPKAHESKKTSKGESCDYSCYLEISLHQHVAPIHEGKKPNKQNAVDFFSRVEIDRCDNILLRCHRTLGYPQI